MSLFPTILDPGCYYPILAATHPAISIPSHPHRPHLVHQSYMAPESVSRSKSVPHSPVLHHRSHSQNLREDLAADCVLESSSAHETHSSSRPTTDNASNISLLASSRPDSSVSQHSQFIGQSPPLSHAATQPLLSQNSETGYVQRVRLQSQSQTEAPEAEIPATLIKRRPPPARRYTTSLLLHMEDVHIRPHLPKLDMHMPMHIPHPQLHLPNMPNVHIPAMHMPAFGEVITHLFAPNAYNATSPTANYPDTHTHTGMHTHGFSYDSMSEAGAVWSEEEIDRPHQRRGSTDLYKAMREKKGKERVERVDSLHVHFQKTHIGGEHDEREHQREEREEERQEEVNEIDGKGKKAHGESQTPCDDGGPLCREAEIEKWKAADDRTVAGDSSQPSWVISRVQSSTL